MRRSLFVIALVSLLAGWSPPVGAAIFGTVKGVVHDPQHRPVPGASVTLKARTAERSVSAVTDGNGEFQFTAVPLGDYIVVVSLDGFEPAEQAVTVTSGATPILHIALAIASLSQTVTVSAVAEPTATGSVTPTTLVDRADIANTPGADRTNSLTAITAFVPGAYVVHDQLHLRGGHQVSWLVDGVPVPNTNIASGVGPQFDPKDIDYLEAERGSYDAEFGDRTYGVFNVVPRTGFERDREIEIVASGGSFYQTNDQVSIGSHTERFGYYVSGSGNRSDLGLETPVADVLHDSQAGASAFGSFIFNANPGNQLRLVTSARRDAYEIPNTPEAQAAGVDDREHESDAFLNASWVRTFHSGLLLTVSPFVHYNSTSFDGGATDRIRTTDAHASRYVGGQATLQKDAGKNSIEIGAYGFHQQDDQQFAVVFSDAAAADVFVPQRPSGGLAVAFVEDKFRPISWLTLSAGLRQTHFSGGIHEDATSPRAGASLQVPSLGWTVRGFYGRFYQAPPLLTASGPLVAFVTSADLGFIPLHGERDAEYQAGVTIPVRDWAIDVDRFDTRATNFFDHNPVGNSNVFFPLTIDGARIRGWEGTLRSPRRWRAAHVHVAYSYQHADGVGGISGGLTDFAPPESGTFPLDHDQRHTVSAGFDLSLASAWFVAANAYYGSGFPDDDTGAYLPGHATVDATVGRRFGDHASASVTLLNLTDRHLLVDNSLTFGGTHFNNPREIYAELRYRFHY